MATIVEFGLLLTDVQNSDQLDFRSLNELPVSMCIMTSSTLYVGALLGTFGSYMGFAKLSTFSSLNNFPVVKLVSATVSGWARSEFDYKNQYYIMYWGNHGYEYYLD